MSSPDQQSHSQPGHPPPAGILGDLATAQDVRLQEKLTQEHPASEGSSQSTINLPALERGNTSQRQTDPLESPQQSHCAGERASTSTPVVAYQLTLDHTSPPTPEIAEQMIGLFNEAFKGRYPNTRLLDVQNLIDDVKAGKYVFVTAFDTSHQLLGMAGLSDFTWLGAEVKEYGSIKELGKLVVAERAQGQGLSKLLTEACINYIRASGAESAVSLGMTTHERSQRPLAQAGFRPTGITVCDWPNVLNDNQRESSVIMYWVTSEQIRGDRQIFVPDSLRSTLEIAIESVGCTRHLVSDPAQVSDLEVPEALDGSGLSTYFELESLSTQIFLSDPSSIDAAIASADDTVQQGSLHISITLDIGKPGALSALTKLIDAGYAYSSFHPLSKGDLLTVQKAVSLPKHYAAGIKCASEETARLLNKIVDQLSHDHNSNDGNCACEHDASC
jgi:RimJ/RimL family protein N-acetyltransferase